MASVVGDFVCVPERFVQMHRGFLKVCVCVCVGREEREKTKEV